MSQAPTPGLSRRQRLARTRLYRRILQKLTPDLLVARLPNLADTPEDRLGTSRDGLTAEVIVYFSGDLTMTYQIEQWLPVLDRLHERHRVLVTTRNLASFRHLQERTTLPLVFVRRLRDLEALFGEVDPKACIYVNNTANNFQPLSCPRALHVHVNHGDSDKISTSTNQAKAYDAVFVAGEAAELRYRTNLINFDGRSMVRVGRPQLDLELEPLLPASPRRTVLYAPTWEGATESMNYTSVPGFGVRLVSDLIAAGFRVVYKPHPRVITGSRPVAEAHRAIVQTIERANAVAADDPHVVELAAQILALFPTCDVLISDVSSVANDWLYLRPDAPLWICDPREDRAALVLASPLARSSYVLDGVALHDVAAQVRESIQVDPRRADREQARSYYFGDLAPGESTRRFIDAISAVISRRDALLAEKSAAQASDIALGAS
jgi:hypothetical protein